MWGFISIHSIDTRRNRDDEGNVFISYWGCPSKLMIEKKKRKGKKRRWKEIRKEEKKKGKKVKK